MPTYEFTTVLRVPRRYSSGAQHSGRGGAGNVFRENEDLAELARKGSREQAVAEDAPDQNTTSSPEPDATAAKRKNWLFGKRP